jgi:hypothetical protein
MKNGLSSFALKSIAIVSMSTDHAGVALFPEQLWMRAVGRLAFPIFAFLLCEGYSHTRSVRRYAVRLGVFALISEIPFDLMGGGNLFDPGHQNIFFTLLIGLLTIYGIDKLRDGAGSIAKTAVTIAGVFLAQLIRADYGAFGVAVYLPLGHASHVRSAVAGGVFVT